LLRRAVGNI